MDKETLSAALWFIVCAVVMTVVGNFVCPQMGNIAASYYTLKPAEKAADTEAAKAESSEKTEAEIVTAETEPPVKAKESPVTETAVQGQTAEKTSEIAASDVASPVSEKSDARSQTKSAETQTAELAPTVTKQPEKKMLTEAEISEATKSMAQGEILELGDGRVAYKIKRGDTFSQICKKVFDTSLGWKEKAKELNIDYRKIRPGDVLIFEKNM